MAVGMLSSHSTRIGAEILMCGNFDRCPDRRCGVHSSNTQVVLTTCTQDDCETQFVYQYPSTMWLHVGLPYNVPSQGCLFPMPSRVMGLYYNGRGYAECGREVLKFASSLALIARQGHVRFFPNLETHRSTGQWNDPRGKGLW